MFADLARRGLTHPHTVAFVKRAVITSEDAAIKKDFDEVEMPAWGVVLVYVSVWVAVVGITMVCSGPLPIGKRAYANDTVRCPT
jgi:hypothetical protein